MRPPQKNVCFWWNIQKTPVKAGVFLYTEIQYFLALKCEIGYHISILRERRGVTMNFAEFVNYLNGIAWGPWMLLLLVGTGVFLSVKLT